jgi:hypothetical protein
LFFIIVFLFVISFNIIIVSFFINSIIELIKIIAELCILIIKKTNFDFINETINCFMFNYNLINYSIKLKVIIFIID